MSIINTKEDIVTGASTSSNNPNKQPQQQPLISPRLTTSSTLGGTTGTTSTPLLEEHVEIKNIDMSEEMKEMAITITKQALEKYSLEKDLAVFIKKQFDEIYGKYWHCIVGRNFGSMVTYEAKCFIYFYYNQMAILLFKSG